MPKKSTSSQKQKSEQHHWILHIRIWLATKFQLKVTILIFWTKFAKKGYFWSKTRKANSIFFHWIFFIGIRLATKISLKLTILIFWTKFSTQKGISDGKWEKMNTAFEFCKFELIYVSSFTLNWQYWQFRLKLPKKGISGRKRKKWTSSLHSAYSN